LKLPLKAAAAPNESAPHVDQYHPDVNPFRSGKRALGAAKLGPKSGDPK